MPKTFPIFLSAVFPLLIAGCCSCPDDEGTDPPDATETPEEDDTQVPSTPWPLELEDGTFQLWSVYTFPSGDYLLNPEGEYTADTGAITGVITWKIYASTEDFSNGIVECAYLETFNGIPDMDIPDNSDCENCQTYYSVEFSPSSDTSAEYGECDEAAKLALLDKNSSGDISTSEQYSDDWWGFSYIADGDYPTRWTQLDAWVTNVKPYLQDNEAKYAIWSKQRRTSDSDYLPLYAAY